MSNVIELVSCILKMDKEIESLKIENQMLKDKPKIPYPCDCEKGNKEHAKDNYIDDLIVEMGLEALYEKVFYSCINLRATRNDKGEVVYTSFDNFIKENIRKDDIPEKVSRFEVLEKLRPLLLEKYENECEKAYDKLLEKEKQERQTIKCQ